MKLISVVFLGVALIILCNGCGPEDCNCSQSAQVAIFNDSVLTNGRARFDKEMRDYYGEAPIHDLDEYVIRFTWASSWRCRKVYQIEPEEDLYKLSTQSYAPIRDSYRDTLVDNFSRLLTTEEINSVRKVMNDSCFWTMPVLIPGRIFLDGDRWILEVNDPDSNNCIHKPYHAVSINCPHHDSLPFFYICDKIMKLDTLNARHKITPW